MVPRLTKPVTHISLASGYRGGERQVELLVRELATRGITQRLVTGPGNQLAERCAGLPHLEIREVASNPVAAGLAARGSAVTHAHEGRAAYASLLAKLLFRVPYVITRRLAKTKAGSPLRERAFRRAAQVVSVSSVGAAGIEERYPGLKVRVIPDALADFAVDEAEVARIRAHWPGKVLLGNVAALDHAVKGQLTLIEAARRAAQERPEWQFVICGEGRDRQRFEEAIKGLTNVALVGWVDNVGDWLSSFDVFVFPSLDEALGSTLLDAMQVGLPIVASRVGGIPDVVEDGVNGRLVEPGDADALYAAIDGLLADADELAAIRTRNIEKSRLFSATQMAEAYETLYREIAPSM